MSAFHWLLLLCATADVISGDDEMHVVDLTHPMDAKSIFWPGNPEYNFTQLFRGQNTQGGFWYEANYFGTAEHGGTHVDAPAHFYKGGYRTQEIPLHRLMGPGVVIDVKSQAAQNPDYRMTVADLQAWETKHGMRIPNGAVVLMNSGWTHKYPNKTLTFGTDNPSDPATFHFPGIHADTAEWLVANRNVNAVGVDTPSVDYGQSKTFPTHVVFGRGNIVGVENVGNLDMMPEQGTMVYIGLIKLFDGSGGPARVFATYDEKNGDDTSGAKKLTVFLAFQLHCLFVVILYFVL